MTQPIRAYLIRAKQTQIDLKKMKVRPRCPTKAHLKRIDGRLQTDAPHLTESGKEFSFQYYSSIYLAPYVIICTHADINLAEAIFLKCAFNT